MNEGPFPLHLLEVTFNQLETEGPIATAFAAKLEPLAASLD